MTRWSYFAICLGGLLLDPYLPLQSVAQDISNTFSGTLPVLYVNTDNHQEIVSKEVYIDAEYWLNSMKYEGTESVGSDTCPLKLKIKGRGNSTWERYEKKPYKIKLAEAIPILGMNKSRHFALLPQAEDSLAFLKNPVAFEISRRIGIEWTPETKPIELFLNGEYKGLYFLTENIRIEKNRVDIEEQANGETDADKITGGWLLEIDQYVDSPQITIREGNWNMMKVTSHSPDSLSNVQLSYLTNFIEQCNNAIYEDDKTSERWEQLIDLESLAKFYIVGEVMDNIEQFHGSCWMYKDRGNTKLHFGPVWDFGICFHVKNEKFIYESAPYGMSWIAEIAKYPRFQQKVREIWNDFYRKGLSELDVFIDSFIKEINRAAEFNYKRWPQYCNSNIPFAVDCFKEILHSKIQFLSNVWGVPNPSNISDPEEVGMMITNVGGELKIFSNILDVSECIVVGINGIRYFPIKVKANCYLIKGVHNGMFVVNIYSKNNQHYQFKVSMK